MSNIALTYEKPPPNLHVLSSWGNRLLWHRAKRGRPLLTFNKFAFLDFSIAEKKQLVVKTKGIVLLWSIRSIESIHKRIDYFDTLTYTLK